MISMEWSESHLKNLSNDCRQSARRPGRLDVLSRHLTVQEDNAFSRTLTSKSNGGERVGAPVVIGGMVLDILASPSSNDLEPGTTSPGEVRYVRGGVGRNIAESLTKLGISPFLISIVGDDMAGESLIAHWISLGLSVEGIRRCNGVSSPVVSAVFDGRGELAAAVANTQAIEVHLTPDWIKQFSKQIRDAGLVLLDANLHPLAIDAACSIASSAGVPVWFEPVSVVKSKRATDLLHLITFASPNEAELLSIAEALSNKKSKNESDGLRGMSKPGADVAISVNDVLRRDLEECIRTVLHAGVKHIVLTLGSQGVILCSKESTGHIVCQHYPALPASIVKVSGAGDCMVAGIVAAMSKKVSKEKAMAYGVAAAKLAVESVMNVPSTLGWDEVADIARGVHGQRLKLRVDF